MYVCIHTYIHIYIYTNTYTHTIEYYSAMRKNDTLPFVKTRMDLEDVMLAK